VRFTPFDAVGGERPDLALQFRLAELRAGDRVAYASGDAVAPAVERGTVVYRHSGGAIGEGAEARGTTFEQACILLTPTALRDGPDVVLEGALDTSLAPDLVGRANDLAPIAFDDGDRPIVTYGEAAAIDALGRRLELATTVRGGAIVIVVDGAWLAQAAFPVTI